MLFASLILFAASISHANRVSSAIAAYGDVIAKPGESEIVVENTLRAPLGVIVNGQMVGVVKSRSTDRFVIPDGNHHIRVQNMARGGGTSRDMQFFTQAKRFFFRATSPNNTTVHLSREHVNDITVANAAGAAGGPPADVPLSETALGQDKAAMFSRMDAQLEGSTAGGAPRPSTPAAAPSAPAPAPAPAVAAAPRAQQPTAAAPAPIAVYVAGDQTDGEKKALATQLLVALVNSGRYVAIERSDEFLAEIESEHIMQRSGAVDDNQIRALGRQFGVQFLCIADITEAFGAFQISARIIDVETAVVVGIGATNSPLRSLNDLSGASYRVVRDLLKE
jgi:nucleoid-associated protein YgaU